MNDTANHLTSLKTLGSSIDFVESECIRNIDTVLKKIKKKTNGAQQLNELSGILHESDSPYGMAIVNDHTAFAGAKNSIFTSATQKFTMEQLLERMDGDDLDKAKLGKEYEKFDKEYRSLIEKHLKKGCEKDQSAVIADLKKITKSLKDKLKPTGEKQIKWDGTVKQKVPVILAHIFAIWSMQHAEQYFDAEGVGEGQKKLFNATPCRPNCNTPPDARDGVLESV